MSPRNARSVGSTRYYAFQGREYPSVTSILQAYPKPHLMSWYGKMAAAEAMAALRTTVTTKEAILSLIDAAQAAHEATKTHQDRHKRACDFVADPEKWLANAAIRYRDAAGARGTSVHEAAERDDELADVPENARKRYEMYRAWVEVYRPTILAKEFQVISMTDGYAGSGDFIAEVNGITYLVDIKTSNSVHHEMRLQLAAYRYAEFCHYDDEIDDVGTAALNRVERCALLHLTDEGFAFLDAAVDGTTYASFLDVKAVFNHVSAVDNTPVGALIAPPVKEIAA